MLDIQLDTLQECWDDLRKFLKRGLIAGDIWDRDTGLSLVGLDLVPEATALINRLTDELTDTLANSGLPGLNRYFLLNLEEDKLCAVIRHGDDLLQGMLLDPKQTNIGILLTVAIPKAIAKVESARV